MFRKADHTRLAEEGRHPQGVAYGTVQHPQSPTFGYPTFTPNNKAAWRLSVCDVVGLILIPWLHFTVVCCLFVFAYHAIPVTVWLLVLCSLVFWSLRSSRGCRQVWSFTLSVSCIAAVVCGTTMGTAIYGDYMAQYWFIHDGRAHTNVLPSDAAIGFADASKIVFTDDARIDGSRAMSYKDRNDFCVAPIVDTSGQTQSTAVQFWAAGTDCCGQRGAFFCDDAWNPQARSGIVMSDASSLRPELHNQYNLAVKQAYAAYNLLADDHPVFVRWVLDPEKVQKNYLKTSMGIFFSAILVYLVFTAILVFLILSIVQRRNKADNCGPQ